MSLSVPADVIAQAERGKKVSDETFAAIIKDSLPHGWNMVTRLVDELNAGTKPMALNTEPPPDEAARGQILRMFASNAMRDALERHFGVRIAFMNCHGGIVFRNDSSGDEAYARYTSTEAQILHQSPELIDC